MEKPNKSIARLSAALRGPSVFIARLPAALRGLKAQQVRSPGQRPGYTCPHSLRPVRAKVKVNHLPILLPLQGVGVYALIPRALPWAINWLPFQGAPLRALFVYHGACFATYYFDLKSCRVFFLDFAPQYCGAKERHESAQMFRSIYHLFKRPLVYVPFLSTLPLLSYSVKAPSRSPSL